jgi:hypothetical protein
MGHTRSLLLGLFLEQRLSGDDAPGDQCRDVAQSLLCCVVGYCISSNVIVMLVSVCVSVCVSECVSESSEIISS